MLRGFYEAMQEKGVGFEIVFVSSDQNIEGFNEYFSQMPWLALPFGDSRKQKLNQLFGVQGIPTLVLLDSDGKVITTEGRAFVTKDPKGANFPWSKAMLWRSKLFENGPMIMYAASILLGLFGLLFKSAAE